MDRAKSTSQFEFHTSKMLEESKRTLQELTLQIKDEKLANSEYKQKFEELTNSKNLLIAQIKELEAEKNQGILNKNTVLQQKNDLIYENKRLDAEFNQAQTDFEVKKKELETEISALKTEQSKMMSLRERENKAFDFESKKMESDIKGMREKIQNLRDSGHKYERIINEYKEKEMQSIENIKKEAEVFRSFVDDIEKK